MYKPHKQLDAWKCSIEAASEVYRLSKLLPAEEKYGLVAQMRRSAVSIASNIAEGAARTSKSEFRHFVSISRSSLSELDTQLDICIRLKFTEPASHAKLDSLLLRVDKLLYGLHVSLTKETRERGGERD